MKIVIAKRFHILFLQNKEILYFVSRSGGTISIVQQIGRSQG